MEPRENAWDLVIKVKYEDTLRRFGAHVHGRSMDHNITKLRTKIISLFKFNPDADLILTYADEDGDVVMLDDDDELIDAAISQRLNPLRIYVQLKTCGSSDPKSQTASSTPTGTRQIETKPPQISSAVDEALKSVPEPFRGVLSTLSHDLVLKAASSAPAFAEFVEYFSKFGLSNVNQASHGPVGKSSGTSSGASTNLMDLSVSDEPKPSTIPLPVPKHIPEQNGSVNMTQGSGETAPTSVDLNLDPPRNPHASECPYINDLLSCTLTTNQIVELQKVGGNAPCDGKSDIATASLSAPPAVEHNSRNFAALLPSVFPNHMDRVAEVSGDGSSKQFSISATPTSQVHNSQFDVHYKTNMGVPMPEVPLPSLSFPRNSWRTHICHDNMPRTFHRTVQCDGCGMYPIMGPRFKSNIKEDYDLCSFCFSEMGNGADYTRIEHAPDHSPRLFKEFYNSHSRYPIRPPFPFHASGVRPSRAKLGSSSRAKLESCFIQDITVVDGTVMSPCTPFTKIWRMRNNGTIAWPFGTQLVWTGGDRFGDQSSVELEFPVNGCPVDEEFDIAVDFTTPSTPGSYISYWRMASSGQEFGQRVWVQIQVEIPKPNSAARSFHADLNLNLPPESSGRNGMVIIDMNAEPLDGACPKPKVTYAGPESLVNATPSTLAEPTMAYGLLGASDCRVQLTPKVVPSVSYPIIDFPELSPNAAPVADAPQSGAATDDNPVERTLLKELEEMGFKQIDLNKEVLRLNEYDLQQSVDHLCGFSE